MSSLMVRFCRSAARPPCRKPGRRSAGCAGRWRGARGPAGSHGWAGGAAAPGGGGLSRRRPGGWSAAGGRGSAREREAAERRLPLGARAVAAVSPGFPGAAPQAVVPSPPRRRSGPQGQPGRPGAPASPTPRAAGPRTHGAHSGPQAAGRSAQLEES